MRSPGKWLSRIDPDARFNLHLIQYFFQHWDGNFSRTMRVGNRHFEISFCHKLMPASCKRAIPSKFSKPFYKVSTMNGCEAHLAFKFELISAAFWNFPAISKTILYQFLNFSPPLRASRPLRLNFPSLLGLDPRLQLLDPRAYLGIGNQLIRLLVFDQQFAVRGILLGLLRLG